jgi:hypothetical protein
LKWTTSDEVGIFAVAGGDTLATNVEYVSEKDSVHTTFTYRKRVSRIRWKDETTSHDFYSYFPYSEDAADYGSVPVSLPSVQEMAGLNDISNVQKYDFMWAATTGKKKADGEVGFAFHHAFSMLDVSLETTMPAIVDSVVFECTDASEPVAFDGAAINLADGSIDASDAVTSNKVSVTCKFLSMPGSVQHIYLMISPGHAGKTFTVMAYVNGNAVSIAEKTAPSGGLPSGKVISLSGTAEISESDAVPIVDLSADETSNTYIISKSLSPYKFNAAVKGSGNVPSGYESVSSGTSLEPKSVLVLWYNCMQESTSWEQACPISLASLSLGEDGYVTFTTPGDMNAGNVVVAAFAEEGLTYDNITADSGVISNATLLWSWNLWCVPGYDADSSAVSVGSFELMDRNLGALIGKGEIHGDGTAAANDDAVHNAAALGNFYQWGRKDPFPYYGTLHTCLTYNTTPTFTPIKALQKSAYGLTGLMFGSSATDFVKKPEDGTASGYDMATIQAYADAHPYIWLQGNTSTNSYHWIAAAGNYYKSLWGDSNSDDSGTVTSKSMYDPCPAGWRLWTAAEYDAVIDAGSAAVNTSGYGIDIAGTYFPMNADGRSYGFTARNWYCNYKIMNVSGRYYNASCTTYYSAWMKKLAFKISMSGTVTLARNADTSSGDGGGSIGANVRCVKE